MTQTTVSYLSISVATVGSWAIPRSWDQVAWDGLILKAPDENETVFTIPAVNPCNILCCGQNPSSGGDTHSYYVDSPSSSFLPSSSSIVTLDIKGQLRAALSPLATGEPQPFSHCFCHDSSVN